jgi:hypothetical protein
MIPSPHLGSPFTNSRRTDGSSRPNDHATATAPRGLAPHGLGDVAPATLEGVATIVELVWMA